MSRAPVLPIAGSLLFPEVPPPPETLGPVLDCPSGHEAAREVRGLASVYYCAACGGAFRWGRM